MLDISAYKVGQPIHGRAVLKEGKTQSPRKFIEGDLIDIMDDIGRYADIGKEEMAVLRQKNSAGSGKAGIGTARTRGEIIKGLFEKELLKKLPAKGKKVYIDPTDKGLALYNVLINAGSAKALISPEMTAKWELGLEKIETGEITIDQFMAKLVPFTLQSVEDLLANPTASSGSSGGGARPGVEPHPLDGSQCKECKKGTLVTGVVTNSASKSFGMRYVRCNNKGKCNYFGDFVK